MGYWARTLVLLLWRVRRRLAPDGSPLEKLLRLPRRAVRLVLGDSKAKKPAASKPLAAATARPAVEGPTVSLLVPLGPATDPATPEALLTETINAVLAQSYPNWELWLCDVGGGAGPAWEAAQRSAASDLRVRTVSLPGGISTAEALNQALKSAVGEMVGLLSPGDLLSPNALDAMLEARKEHAGADVLYSDEDSVDARGIHGAPLSKFNWSPELALAYPYTGRLCLMQRTLVLDLGGYRPETLAAEEYDLILRAATRGVRIEHVRQVLYSRRRRRDGEPDIFGTIAAVEARRAALEEHLARRRIPAEIVQVEGPERLRVRPTIQGRPLVSIIIPTRDKLSLLRQCIGSIEAKTRDLPYEIVIVDNNSVEPDTLAYFASFGATSGHTIVPYPGPFNFAGEINAGARAANGEYLVLLNNDTEIISPDWLTALLEWSQLPGIGCVGARLLFDNGAFQHVGIALYQGSAHHPFYLKQTGQENRWTDTDLVRNCAGATAACLMVHRDRFEQLGGFDESFPINYNDIDFCIRLAEQGYRNLYTPYAVLYHHESSSRPPGVTEAEHARLRERHGPLLWNDPYWGPSARPATPEVAKQAKGPAPAPAPLLTAAKNLVRTRIDRERTMLREALDVTRYEGEGESFYGLPVSADIPTEIGSSNAIRWQELVDVAGDPKLTLFMHPPYSRGFIVKLPEQAAVRVSSALVPEVWGLNKGGVEFTVSVGPLGGSPFVTQSWIVNPGQIHEDRTWRTVTLDLAAYAGQTVEVRLGTAVAPGAPSAYAWAIWGDPRLLVRRPTRAVVLNELHEGVYRLRTRGPRGPLKRYRTLAAQASSATRARKPFAGYAIWLRGHLRDEAALEQTRLESERFSYRPTISLITPVYNTDPHWLELLVASIKGQTYPNWELCLCDDGSTNQATIDYLAKLANDDPRIKTSRLPQNGGISAASNGALALATGEFIGLLDHDDELTLDALYEVARVLQTHPDADLIYSDEDKLEPDGSPSEPFFKPDWSPDYLNSTMYVGHLGVYRRSIVDMVGGFRTEFDGSQDYDLALRVSEHAKRVCHIPRILYRWRKIATSTAGTGEAKPWALDASFRALADHATRLSPPARAENRPGSGYARVKYQIVGNPLVSIVIPTDGRIADTAAGPRDLLLNCVRSVVERTAYKNYELVIVDNGHVSAAAETYLATVPHRRLTYHETVPFNFANKVNFAINGAPGEHARGEHILLLNDDIEVISEEWLSAMLEFSQQPDVGVVGAKLYFPDGRLQHIGVIVGIGGGAVHIFSGFPKDHPGHFGAAKLIRDFSAVTGACMMTSRAAFERVGGFNETFLTDFNDVDYCLRLRELGYRIVYQPFAELTHYEGATFGSRERIVNPAEVQAFSDNWGHVIANDPYFNPNLSRATQTYDVRM